MREVVPCFTKILDPYSYSLLFEQIVILEDKTVVKSQMKHFCFNNAKQNVNSLREIFRKKNVWPLLTTVKLNGLTKQS